MKKNKISRNRGVFANQKIFYIKKSQKITKNLLKFNIGEIVKIKKS